MKNYLDFDPKDIAALSAKYDYNVFFTDESNINVYRTIQMIKENPGEIVNPFFVIGSDGVGKTHLCMNMAQELALSGIHTKMITCENLVSALNTEEICEADVLIIEDIESIKKDIEAQEILALIVGVFVESNKQVILTSNIPIGYTFFRSKAFLEMRKSKKAEYEFVFYPEQEIKMKLLSRYEKELGIYLDAMNEGFLVSDMIRTAGEIRTILMNILALQKATGERPDMDMIKRLIFTRFNA